MAKNDLEAFIYDMSDKLNDEDHEKCSTATEREEYSKLLAEAGEWMYEQEEDAKKEVIYKSESGSLNSYSNVGENRLISNDFVYTGVSQ